MKNCCARLKRLGIYPDASFSSEIVRLSVKHFVEFIDDLLDAPTKKSLHKQLIKDHQLKDKSFKAVSTRILKSIASKAAGEVGDEITDLFGDAVKGLLTGVASHVSNAIADIDLLD